MTSWFGRLRDDITGDWGGLIANVCRHLPPSWSSPFATRFRWTPCCIPSYGFQLEWLIDAPDITTVLFVYNGGADVLIVRKHLPDGFYVPVDNGDYDGTWTSITDDRADQLIMAGKVRGDDRV